MRAEHPIGGNPFAGFYLVLTSPYLLSIALFVFFLASLTTVIYFEQLRLVEHMFADTADRTRIFARLDWVVQSLTVLCQMFLTGRIASRLGLTAVLMVVPLSMIFGFIALAARDTFLVLAILFVTRQVGEFAFVRPACEMLFSKLDIETKYKAKNVIDVAVYRGADAVTAQQLKVIEHAGLAPGGIAMIGAGVAAAWAVNASALRRQNDRGETHVTSSVAEKRAH